MSSSNAYQREWCRKNPEKRAAIAKRWREKNKEKCAAANKKYRMEHKQQLLEKKRGCLSWTKGYRAARYRDLVNEAIDAMGPNCQCCGESERSFMTFEHKYGNPEKYANGIRKTLMSRLRALKRLGWPECELTVLCYNCNCSVKWGGECAHLRREPAFG